MRGFEVRPVCSRIAIDLEHPDAGRVVPFRDGVEDQHTRFGSDGGLDLLVNRGPVIFNLRGINLDFCDLDVPPLASSPCAAGATAEASIDAPKIKSCFASIVPSGRLARGSRAETSRGWRRCYFGRFSNTSLATGIAENTLGQPT